MFPQLIRTLIIEQSKHANINAHLSAAALFAFVSWVAVTRTIKLSHVVVRVQAVSQWHSKQKVKVDRRRREENWTKRLSVT